MCVCLFVHVQVVQYVRKVVFPDNNQQNFLLVPLLFVRLLPNVFESESLCCKYYLGAEQEIVYFRRIL